MEIPDTHIDLIEQYLTQQLAPPDRTAFEARLAAEPALAEQLQLYREARESIDLFAEEQLKKKFREQYFAEAETAAAEATLKPLFQRRTWYMVAAAAVVLLFAVWLGSRLTPNAPSPESLYAANYVLPSLSVRGTEANSLDSASTLMSQGDFMNALPILEALVDEDTFARKPAAWYRMGLCQMELGDFNAAVDAFSQIPPENTLVHSGRWYSALSYLRLNELPMTRQQLELILENSRDVALKEQAQQLLDLLKLTPQ